MEPIETKIIEKEAFICYVTVDAVAKEEIGWSFTVQGIKFYTPHPPRLEAMERVKITIQKEEANA